MKQIKWMAAFLMAAVLIGTGCSEKGVKTSKLESSFKGSEPAAQSSVDKVVAAVKSEDYAAASAELQKLAAQAKLTDAQKQAVTDVVEQVKKALAAKVEAAGKDLNKAAGDLQKSLPK